MKLTLYLELYVAAKTFSTYYVFVFDVNYTLQFPESYCKPPSALGHSPNQQKDLLKAVATQFTLDWFDMLKILIDQQLINVLL